MLCFRIEHDVDGIGLFQKGDTRFGDEIYDHLLETIYSKHELFPIPYDDTNQEVPVIKGMRNWLKFDKDRKRWFCAYKSIDQINYWFNTWDLIFIIRKVGFKIYKLEVEEYQLGKEQILFTKESILSKEDITSLFVSDNKENKILLEDCLKK
jgi:hypothetical protein